MIDFSKITLPLDILDIEAVLPHRIPFLLVDKVLELTDDCIVAIKNVTMNEWYFQGHFPDKPVMPGVLQIEALAQAGAILALLHEPFRGKMALLGGIDNAKFRRVVRPGDVLTLDVRVTARRGLVGKSEARALVDGQVACSCNITYAIADSVPYK